MKSCLLCLCALMLAGCVGSPPDGYLREFSSGFIILPNIVGEAPSSVRGDDLPLVITDTVGTSGQWTVQMLLTGTRLDVDGCRFPTSRAREGSGGDGEVRVVVEVGAQCSIRDESGDLLEMIVDESAIDWGPDFIRGDIEGPVTRRGTDGAIAGTGRYTLSFNGAESPTR